MDHDSVIAQLIDTIKYQEQKIEELKAMVTKEVFIEKRVRVRATGSRRNRVQKVKYIAYLRQRGQCYICYREVPEDEATAEHLIPSFAEGENTDYNIVMSCLPCNTKRSAFQSQIAQEMRKDEASSSG